MSFDLKAAGLGIHWHIFGSNGEKKPDYSRGVLERFTRRAEDDWYVPPNADNEFIQGNCYIKKIVNPRKIKFFDNPHKMNYVADFYGIDENLNLIKDGVPFPITTEKIVINHYYVKSKPEFEKKVARGSATRVKHQKKLKWFEVCDRNEEFDDGILKYRDARQENFAFEIDYDRLARVAEALTEILPNVDYMETALTCRALSSYLQEKFPDDDYWRKCEAESIAAVVKLLDKMKMNETQLFVLEVPKLWHLPYPAVNDLRDEFIQCVPKILDEMHLRRMWSDYVNLDSLQHLLKFKE